MFGDPICALRVAFPVAWAVIVTVEPFLKIYPPPLCSRAISAVFFVATLQGTLPAAMSWFVMGAARPSPSAFTWSAANAIAGTAMSTAIVKKRSDILPLNMVRKSTCLPSRFPYTSRSLCPFLSLSPLLLGCDLRSCGR
jgi:hypothetical protein